MSLSYQLEPDLTGIAFQDILVRSSLAERRPTNLEQLESMCRQAQIILTCRDENKTLVGVSRAITDYSYSVYLSDLAVDQNWQKQGIGKELIGRTHEEAGLKTNLILLSAPAAAKYYPHVGMDKHNSCWIIKGKG